MFHIFPGKVYACYFPQVTGKAEISVKFEIIENNSLLDSVNTLEGREAIQKDPDRLEVGSTIQIQQGQMQGPTPGPGQFQAQTQTGWKMDQDFLPRKKDLGVFVD